MERVATIPEPTTLAILQPSQLRAVLSGFRGMTASRQRADAYVGGLSADRADHGDGAAAALVDGREARTIEESFELGETVSSVARRLRGGTKPPLSLARLISEGSVTAVGSNEPVVGQHCRQ